MDPTPILQNEVTFSSDITAFGPQVVPLPDNTFVLAWENETDIFARHLDQQGSFIGGDFLSILSANDSKVLGTPRLFRQDNGFLVVTYRQQSGPGDKDVLWHQVDPNFIPDGNTFPIESSSSDEALMDSTARIGGGAIAYGVPRHPGGPESFVVLRFIDSIGQQASNQIFVGNSGGVTQQDAVVAGLHNGNVVVAYTNRQDPTSSFGFDVRLHIFQPDETDVTGEVFVSGNNSLFPAIAVLRDGSFVVAWQESQGVGFSHFSPQGVADPALPVQTVPHSSGAFLPKVTALNDGGFLIAWTAASGVESDGSPNEDIFLQRYGFQGSSIAPIGAQVHLAQPGDQGLFSLSMGTLVDGRVILAYESETGDATNVTTLVYRFVLIP